MATATNRTIRKLRFSGMNHDSTITTTAPSATWMLQSLGVFGAAKGYSLLCVRPIVGLLYFSVLTASGDLPNFLRHKEVTKRRWFYSTLRRRLCPTLPSNPTSTNPKRPSAPKVCNPVTFIKAAPQSATAILEKNCVAVRPVSVWSMISSSVLFSQ